MISLSYREIEESLGRSRDGRRLVMPILLSYLTESETCTDHFLTLSRFFCRLKSADSVVEKALRKRIAIHSPRDLSEQMSDLLGFRVVVASQGELRAVDAFLKQAFEVVQVNDQNETPGEFGERGIEYRARYHLDGETYVFEIQLRTFLQHYWACQTFHLFHKQPKELALANKDGMQTLAAALAEAERLADDLEQRTPTKRSPERADLALLTDHVRLVVIGAGEEFADYVTHELSGRPEEDHAAIVAKKMSLYERFPSAAIVECSCMSFLAFHQNEPLVRVPVERLGRTLG